MVAPSTTCGMSQNSGGPVCKTLPATVAFRTRTTLSSRPTNLSPGNSDKPCHMSERTAAYSDRRPEVDGPVSTNLVFLNKRNDVCETRGLIAKDIDRGIRHGDCHIVGSRPINDVGGPEWDQRRSPDNCQATGIGAVYVDPGLRVRRTAVIPSDGMATSSASPCCRLFGTRRLQIARDPDPSLSQSHRGSVSCMVQLQLFFGKSRRP